MDTTTIVLFIRQPFFNGNPPSRSTGIITRKESINQISLLLKFQA